MWNYTHNLFFIRLTIPRCAVPLAQLRCSDYMDHLANPVLIVVNHEFHLNPRSFV